MFCGCLLGHWLESSGKARSSPLCVLWLWSRNAGFSEVIGKAVCAPALTLTGVNLDCWWQTPTGAQPHFTFHFTSAAPSSPRGLAPECRGSWVPSEAHSLVTPWHKEVQRDFRLFWPAVLTGNTVGGKIKTTREQVRFSQARASPPWIGADRRMGGSSLWWLLERQASINNLVYVIPRQLEEKRGISADCKFLLLLLRIYPPQFFTLLQTEKF